MRNKAAQLPTHAARSVWVTLSCLCFLCVSLLTPVYAATMMSGGVALQSVQIDHPDFLQNNASGTAHHEPAADDHCVTTSCDDHSACTGFCLHCSSCNFSASISVTLTPLAQQFGLSEPLLEPCPDSLLPGRRSPPFRPPISRH